MRILPFTLLKTSFKLLDTDVLKTHWGYVLETILLAEKLETKQMKQKVAFMNAFPGDTFLREFNFAD